MEMWQALDGGQPPLWVESQLWVDWTRALSAAGFMAIAMDQRNAGRSRTDIAADHGWHTYADDHLALLDHLGLDRVHLLGGCIGCSFSLKLAERAPDRLTAAVLQNPIGLHPDQPDFFQKEFVDWSKEQRFARPELDEAALAAFGRNIWDHDFIFSIDWSVARNCLLPCLLMPGTDVPHPPSVSSHLAALLPNVEVLEEWRGPEYLAVQEHRVLEFLRGRTPS
jgi:pimeloyl-ACP methyl ester carboxylesterase